MSAEERRGMHFDAASSTWTDVAGLDAMLVLPATVVLDGRIVLLGGWYPEPQSAPAPPIRIRVYDPARDAWTVGAGAR